VRRTPRLLEHAAAVAGVELDFDLKGRAVMGFCLLKESLLLSEALANPHQRLAGPAGG